MHVLYSFITQICTDLNIMNEAALPEHGEWAVVLLSIVSQQVHLHVFHKVIVLPFDLELVQPPALCQLKHPQGVVLFGRVPVVLK